MNFKSASLFCIYKIVDNMDTYKSSNINIETLMKNSGIVKFILDHIKTKLMCNYAVKNKLL